MAGGTPEVKICGVTRLEDAELAVHLGAWAVGMVFHADSPRRCSLDEARRISASLRRRTALCGVFVNSSLEELTALSRELDLALVQLHGDEGPSFCAEAGRRTGARVIKALQVRASGDVEDAERFRVDFHLLDARPRAPQKRTLRGGSGETFDWGLLAARRSDVPLILSGGLEPENVAAGIAAARTHGLFAVDTASGTEAAPGRKDPEKLRAFFAAVHASGADAGERGGSGAAAAVGSPA
jgi:phosphoribosylanthranilate isomerase